MFESPRGHHLSPQHDAGHQRPEGRHPAQPDPLGRPLDDQPLSEHPPDDLLGDRRVLLEERPPLRSEGAQLRRHRGVVDHGRGALEGVELAELAGEACPAHNLVRANSEPTSRHQRRWPDLCGSVFVPEGDRAPARGANQVLWGP